MLIYVVLFVVGAVIGSFLNVCIYRWPREEKIGMTRSRCPHCKKTIVWYDNIPFISYLLLKGKCRYCKKTISFRYFVVEFLSAIALCLAWWRFGPAAGIILFIFMALLIIGSFVDLEFFIIPDSVTLGGIIIGVIAGTVYPALLGAGCWWQGLLKSVLGVVIPGGALYLIAITGSLILKKEAMGMGDVKLVGMIGSFIGWPMGLFSIFIASLLGSVAGITLIIMQKTDLKGKIPFGPYLAVGAVISMFWGRVMVNWYLNLL